MCHLFSGHLITYTTTEKFGISQILFIFRFLNKSKLLFSKDVLNWLKVTVKLQIYIYIYLFYISAY